jgi:integrase
VLVDAELRAVWRALGDNRYGTIVRLLILTGQRLNEIAGLRWAEIDFDRNVISLPGERTKNKRPHEVPMAPQVRSLLEAQERIDDREPVFGRGDGPCSGFWRHKAKLDSAIRLAPWVLHDLRRSVATGMAELGIQPHIIEAVLNHVSGHKAGVAGVYNRATYLPEKTAALARWADHLPAVVAAARLPVATTGAWRRHLRG